ncbi:hypothetical protein HO173_005505 [Letharia columbiana]|uniref:Isochorismatase-like domain-containing protein n=1 Tax=Letharia columbiana TaxID=112416 RepID=A0A8H6L5M0_9LECA|nr:uncharacterized protein HO173_005505 [Letharia columbiana]KAF6236413.1 hypothetical protein HO173_005505 [Letharia columbiana]
MSSLLLIDLQQDFVSPTRIPAKPFIDSLPPLLRQFTTRRRPIVWIDSVYEQGKGTCEEDVSSNDPPQSDFELYLSGTHRSGRFCVHDTPGIQIHKDLLPFLHAHHIRITKNPLLRNLTKTALHDTLQQTKHFFLAGVTTNTCIAATAVDARKLGYEKPYDVDWCTSNNVSSYLGDDKQLQQLPVLYWVKGSIPSWRVMITLAWMKIPYLSKRLRTPTFVDSDGTIVIESMAILQYLERFSPGTRENRPSDLSKSEWTQETVRFHESEKPNSIYEPTELLYDAEWEKHRENILQAYHDVFKEFEHWERYLTNGGFLSARHAFGLADCAFYPVLAYMVHRGLALTSKLSGLENHYERCGALQTVLEASPDHWETPGKSLFLRCEKMLKE